MYYFQQKGASLGVTKKEIEIMLGIHIEMGTMAYPQIRLYWSSNRRHALIANSMTLNRFSKIRNNLHLVDNLQHDETSNDKYWKVRPILDKFQERILLEKVEAMLSIDEQMCPFRGRKIPLGIRQYMKGKPTPWGIKFFFLCGVSGMPYAFRAYQGASTPFPEQFKPYGIGGAVVLELVTSRIPENSQASLFTDRFFTSPPVVKKLLDYGIYSTGTVLSTKINNAPLMSNKVVKKRARGTMDGCVSKDESMGLVKWKDNNIVCLLSSAYPYHTTEQVERFDKSTRSYVKVPCPSSVIYYNKNMGGVDRLDYFVSLYRIYIKSKKWPLRVIFHFIDLFVVVSWLQYKRDCESYKIPKKEQKSLMFFRLEISEILILFGYNPLDKRTPGKPKVRHTYTHNLPPEVRYDGHGHFPEWKKDDRQRCVNCASAKTPKFSFVQCMKCHVFLCFNANRNCFTDYHKKP